MNDHFDDALVAHLEPGAHPLLSGRWGGALLVAPGAMVVVIGIAMTILFSTGVSTALFGGIIIVSGLFAISSGLGIRRLAVARRDDPPVAFALDADGVEVHGKKLSWDEAKFRVDASVDPPMVICGGGKAAWPIDGVDVTIPQIETALARFAQ